MPDVKLTRDTMVTGNNDYAVCISFTDIDGKSVSLAFDGRPEVKAKSGFGESLQYHVFSDCPIFGGDNEAYCESDSLQVIRNLRDALMNLNLGD